MLNLLVGVIAGVALTLSVQRIIEFIGIYRPWMRATMSGAPVSLAMLIGMRLRGSPLDFLLDTHLAVVHAGKKSDLRLIESCYLANQHLLPTNDMEAFLQLVEVQLDTHLRNGKKSASRKSS